MTIDLKEFQRLTEEVGRLQREADKAAGAYDEQMRRLKDEFDCDSIAEAKELLTELESEVTTAEKAYGKAVKKFEKEWADVLGENADQGE